MWASLHRDEPSGSRGSSRPDELSRDGRAGLHDGFDVFQRGPEINDACAQSSPSIGQASVRHHGYAPVLKLIDDLGLQPFELVRVGQARWLHSPADDGKLPGSCNGQPWRALNQTLHMSGQLEVALDHVSVAVESVRLERKPDLQGSERAGVFGGALQQIDSLCRISRKNFLETGEP